MHGLRLPKDPPVGWLRAPMLLEIIQKFCCLPACPPEFVVAAVGRAGSSRRACAQQRRPSTVRVGACLEVG